MEGMAVNAYKNLKGMCRRRGYKRLNGRCLRTTAELGAGTDTKHRRRRRSRSWRIKISPKKKLRMMISLPNKLLAKLRDAYVSFMLRLSASPFVAGAVGGYGAVDYGVGGFGMMRPNINKDYDEKVIIEIYKSLVRARPQFAVRDLHH